ncbi:MAG: hypothetical protein KIG88_03930 [Weeksellaceae bacterium]|nr:hypothetical protein [Weeksellaceae bacterium]
MKNFTKAILAALFFVVFLSFTTIIQDDLKIIRYKKANDGYLVIEYMDGKIKKQIKNRQVYVYLLPFNEKAMIDQAISKLDINNVIEEIDSINKPIIGTAYMYLFIKNNDTLRTRFYPEGYTPKQLQRLDYLLNKNRK